MSFFSECAILEQLVADNGWAETPDEFVTREGKLAKIIDGRWRLPCENHYGSVNIRDFGSPILQWVVAKYMVYVAQTVSSVNSFNNMSEIKALLAHRDFFSKSRACLDPDLLKPALITQMEIMIERLKLERKLWRAYRPVCFYIWGAENYPELGFCESFANYLDCMKIPGGPKGEAVRSQDPEQGSLHPHLEITLIVDALRKDRGKKFKHYQQRAAVALAKSYGRNPANYIALREEDIFDLVDDPASPEWAVKLPRIKKGFRSARSDFVVEALDSETYYHVNELVKKNQAFKSVVEVSGRSVACARPLFRRFEPNNMRMQTGDYESAYHMYTVHFAKLLRDFSVRMGLVSPLTEAGLILTARRFRYTVGTTYAAMGMSRKELAHRLDHSDLQNVQVYYDILDSMTHALDKASLLKYSRFVQLFCGAGLMPLSTKLPNDQLIVTDQHSQPGDVDFTGACGFDDFCHKYPPYSCYLCPKFRPYKSDIHERILEKLINSHNERPESQTLGVHRVDVILAVAQVVRMCQEGAA
ncbi:hypothetical protein [Pseudomonas sp. NMI1173_11]|uniref:hypothetical protein n=1 Tax=Pseudomonas sp. NMI1173_11 TaxID=2903145 RepID=UPI001E633D33|nr:hypothetical protein [Pseudomonas sp. NMI1173_11]MCE1004387.1 hypothetical protein [Pseudomonas sp. NMI1173_11]